MQKEALKEAFEIATDSVVARVENPDLIEVMASIEGYREWIVQNVEQSGPVDPQTFARWMESADRDIAEFPAPWVRDLMEKLDAILVSAAREENMQPGEIAAALNEWVEESEAEAEQIHGLEEGFFDV